MIAIVLISSAIFLIYSGIKSNHEITISKSIPISSYYTNIYYITVFNINKTILFNNRTTVNTNSMFYILTKNFTVNAIVNTTANSINGTYTINESIKTDYWSKSLGSTRGVLNKEMTIFIPNFSYYENLMNIIDKQLQIQTGGYTIILNISFNGVMNYPYGNIPFNNTNSILIYIGYPNVTVNVVNDPAISGNFYKQVYVNLESGYNYAYFYFGGFLLLLSIAIIFIRLPSIYDVIRRQSVRGPSPPPTNMLIEISNLEDFLRVVKQYGKVPIAFDNGFYIIDNDVIYVYYNNRKSS
ncbi:MAG: hypothetical protein QXY87_10800 [Saccharolobus sp.]|uniref:hypothetical protein n=2 Tax=Sulfolobaceae TaxID=118883 RepID=UPI001C45B473|nr:hypothetical protein [Saccharolobus shibatae]